MSDPVSDSPVATLFGVLDLARSPDIWRAMMAMAPDNQCLFGGELGDAVRQASPHLVCMPDRSPFLAWWRDTGTGKAWGIALRTRVGAATLRLHLKTLLRARLSDGALVLFRFWDPRVLARYLPACTEAEQAAFFGPIEAFYIEDTGNGAALTFRNPRPEGAGTTVRPSPSMGIMGLPMPQAVLDAFAPLGVEAMVGVLRQRCEDHCQSWTRNLTMEEVERRVRIAVRRAMSYGFESEGGIGLYLLRMITAGPNFDRLPALRVILTDPALDEAGKHAALSSRDVAYEWAKAKAHGLDWED